MPKYMFHASYTPEGAQGLVRDGGTGRREAVDSAVRKLGGRLEAFYYAFGDVDVVTILDLPDATSAMALSLAVNKTGLVAGSLTPLITAEEMDDAAKRQIDYRPPGK